MTDRDRPEHEDEWDALLATWERDLERIAVAETPPLGQTPPVATAPTAAGPTAASPPLAEPTPSLESDPPTLPQGTDVAEALRRAAARRHESGPPHLDLETTQPFVLARGALVLDSERPLPAEVTPARGPLADLLASTRGLRPASEEPLDPTSSLPPPTRAVPASIANPPPSGETTVEYAVPLDAETTPGLRAPLAPEPSRTVEAPLPTARTVKMPAASLEALRRGAIAAAAAVLPPPPVADATRVALGQGARAEPSASETDTAERLVDALDGSTTTPGHAAPDAEVIFALTKRATRPPPAPGPSEEPAPPRAPSQEPQATRGADVAREAVQRRRPREERFRLVGRTREALTAQRELLVALAAGRTGGAAATLLVAAGELADECDLLAEAHAHYAAARRADPRNVAALRGLRRHAIAAADWEACAQLLAAEALLPLAPESRALAYAALAELELTRLGDAAAAARSARAAVALRGTLLPASLVELAAAEHDEHAGAARAALEQLAEAWPDPNVQASLWAELGAHAEAAGDSARAARAYHAAASRAPRRLDVWVGLARAAGRAGDTATEVRALESAAKAASATALRDAFLRLAAVRLARSPEGVVRARALLSGAASLGAVWVRARLAAGEPATDEAGSALERAAELATGAEASEAHVALALLHAERGDGPAALAALGAAGRTGFGRQIAARARDRIRRRHPGLAATHPELRPSESVTGATALREAALALVDGDGGRERGLLVAGSTERGLVEHALALAVDAVAEDPRADLDGALAREGDLREASARAPWVAARLAHRPPGAPGADALELVAELPAPERTVVLWLASWGLATRGRAQTPDGLRRALDALDPAHRRRTTLALAQAFATEQRGEEAAGLLESIHGDRAALEARAELASTRDGRAALLAELAAAPPTATDRAAAVGDRVRAALLAPPDGADASAAWLAEAFELLPSDPTLLEAACEATELGAAADRRDRLHRLATRASDGLSRTAYMRALFAAWRASDAPAAVRCASALREASPREPLGDAVEERALADAGTHDVLVARAIERLATASSEAVRRDALDRLLGLELLSGVAETGAAAAVAAAPSLATPAAPLSLRLRCRRELARRGDARALCALDLDLLAGLAPTDLGGALRSVLTRALHADALTPAASASLLTAHAAALELDGWFARQLEAAALSQAQPALLARAREALCALAASPFERATFAALAAEALEASGEPVRALERLRDAVGAAPGHPVALERLARLEERLGHFAEAARSYEAAAAAAASPVRAVRLWLHAASLWEDAVASAEDASRALERVRELEPRYPGVCERLEGLYVARGLPDRALDLLTAELAATQADDKRAQATLHARIARVHGALGHAAEAKAALRLSLALEPDEADRLRQLAEMCLATDDWRGAAEALIRTARLRKNPDELRWVFFVLGDIYDVHMPDARRAEAAFQRVLKLVPDDTEALERLAALYRREGNLEAALRTLGELARAEVDPERRRLHHVELATVHEDRGDLPRAAEILTAMRDASPTDREVLRVLTEFHRRTGSPEALDAHLARAAADARSAVTTDALDAEAWHTLAQVLAWREEPDAAACIVDAARALGVRDPALESWLPEGATPAGRPWGIDRTAAVDALAPEELPAALRTVLQACGEALLEAVPFDVAVLRPTRLGDGSSAFERALVALSCVTDVSRVRLVVSDVVPTACVPIAAGPTTILVGRTLIDAATEGEARFLLTRALLSAEWGLAPLLRAPEHTAIVLAAVARAGSPYAGSTGLVSPLGEEITRRLRKALSRRSRDAVEAGVAAAFAGGGPEPARVLAGGAALVNRLGLLVTGAIGPALAGLLRLADAPRGDPALVLPRVPEAIGLLRFAISDAHFEARRSAGVEP